MTCLAHQVAIITGGGTGIGRAIATAFARAGAAVALTGRRREPLAEAVREILADGGRAIAIQCDVANAEDTARAVSTTVSTWGGLHLLVNNAGVARYGALGDMSSEDIEAMVDVDLKGPMYMTRSAWPHLRQHAQAGGAAVINISSSVTQGVVKNFSVYSAAKAGVDMLTRCWALDFAPDRIRVNAICPGVVETPILATLMPQEAIAGALASFAQATPLGRVGQPADIAELALFLASPQSAWLTGAVIPHDGGLSLVSA